MNEQNTIVTGAEPILTTFNTPSELLMTINNNIIRLNVQMENVLRKVDEQQGVLKEYDSRLDKLERAEGERAQNMWKGVVASVGTILTSLLLAYITSRVPPFHH